VRSGVFKYSSKGVQVRSRSSLKPVMTQSMTKKRREEPNEFGEYAYQCSGCEVWFFSVRPPHEQPNFCVDCAVKKQVVSEV
jgi:hypothetical protein